MDEFEICRGRIATCYHCPFADICYEGCKEGRTIVSSDAAQAINSIVAENKGRF